MSGQFSDQFVKKLNKRKDEFNEIFSSITDRVFNKSYPLEYDVKEGQSNTKYYKFYLDSGSGSTGNNQIECVCFDLALIELADRLHRPCLHFLLSDKKELIEDEPFMEISALAEQLQVQVIFPILENRLPSAMKQEQFYAVKLSQENKLFKF